MKSIFLDAGPWVDYFNLDGKFHAWSQRQFERFTHFVSCEVVLGEVCARLRYYGLDERMALRSVQSGQVKLDFPLGEHVSGVLPLMNKYADQQMDVADACLLWMSHLEKDSILITLDKQFRDVYRIGRDNVPHELPEGV